MHPDKCRGPNGYNLGFYQHFWTLCIDDIFKEVCIGLETCHLPTTRNMTNIPLILKGSIQTRMKG